MKKIFQEPTLVEETTLAKLTLFQSISGTTCGAQCV